MNDTNSTNKSLYDSQPTFYHERPANEIKNFSKICNTNLDALEEQLELISIDNIENVWDEIVVYKEVSDKLSEEINRFTGSIALTEGEIAFQKKRICARTEDITDIEQLIKECVVMFKELEAEKNEFTRNIVHKHKAIKLATKYFKTRLNIYISLEKKCEIFYVTIHLFTEEENDKYSFIISLNEDQNTWKLESCKPKLSDKQFLLIQQKFTDEQNICALLCFMRKIFLSFNY